MMETIIKAPRSPEPTEMELAHRALARKAAAAGYVLLHNQGVLPLKGSRIALFGSGARITVKGGTGSGAVRERYSVSVEEGLKAAGCEIVSQAWLDRFDRYSADDYESYRIRMEEKVTGVTDFYRILGMVEPYQHPVSIPITPEEAPPCDAAVYVLARQAGEGNDRKNIPGDWQLAQVEMENLRFLSNRYEKLIVVVNAGGLIDLSFMDEVRVDALVYMVQGGEEGGHALADVLLGKTNFSGHLTDSWPLSLEDSPASNYAYASNDPRKQVYHEGICVGYRYYDTFNKPVRYAFGYGLSYTCFQVKAEVSAVDETGISIGCLIENTGTYPGQEVVQLYATVPYGETGAEYQRLAAYGKTKELLPGEQAQVTLHVPYRLLCCYEEEKSAWVLRAGDYILRMGGDSRTNRAFVIMRNEQEQVIERCRKLCAPQEPVKEFVMPGRRMEDTAALPVVRMPSPLPCICHHYSPCDDIQDPLADTFSAAELATLLCGAGTSARNLQVTALGASGSTTAQLYEKHGIPNIILSDGPAGLNLTMQVIVMPDGTVKGARTPENLEAYKRYLFGASKYGMLRQMALPEEGISYYQYATAWPCAQLLAQTFDTSLVEQIGDALGEEMTSFGITVWLAPGMNIHRHPLCGRTFEYYSEDPLISGKTAAAMVRGVQKHPGCGVSIKHFAANSCELERNMSDSVLSERALREIYLTGFEIAVRESSPMTVMAAYNKINGVYCTNHSGLLHDVLRCEWGFCGLVMSDWDAMKAQHTDCMQPVSADVLKAHAAQCDLVMPGRLDQREALVRALESGLVSWRDMQRSAARILRLIRINSVLESR